MFLPRAIPCLLLRRNGLVKTVKFKSPKYVGDPINAIKIFNDKRVDELIFLDIDATRSGAEPNYRLIEEIASECFMPVCYGGGIRSVDQARRIANLGIEKIAVNHQALRNPELIRALADVLGSQSVVGAIDVKKNWRGRYRVYDSARRKLVDLEPRAHAAALVDAGAGEVFVNNVDADGTQLGYDIGLLRELSQEISVPMVACGGAGSLEDLRQATKEGGVAAAAAGSLFVFRGRHRAVLINYPSYEELRALFG